MEKATLAKITKRLGPPATSAQLQTEFGPNWLQTFIQYEPVGESCVWYLDSAQPASQAFQLCFNGSNLLVDKQIVAASGANNG